jgi:hypothetical protein
MVYTGSEDSNGDPERALIHGLSVSSLAYQDIMNLAVGAAGGGAFALAGSVDIEVIENISHAYIGAGTTVNADNGAVRVLAVNDTEIFSLAGSLGIAGAGPGIGAGLDVGVLTKDTQAIIADSASVDAGKDVIVQAISFEDILSIGVSGGIGAAAGVAGSVSVYTIDLITRAYIGADSEIGAGGSVMVSASDETEMDIIDGAISGGSAGVGAGAGVTVITKTTEAYIDDHAVVDAKANQDAIEVKTGQFDITITPVPEMNGTLSFHDNGGSPDTITRSDGGSWSTDGFKEGQTISIAGSDDNDGTYMIDSVTAGTITLNEDDELTNESSASDVNVVMMIGEDGEVGASGGGSTDLGEDIPDIDGSTLSMKRTSEADTIDDFKGVAVTAVNKDNVRKIVAAAGAGVAAVSVSGSVSVVDVTTHAYIDDGAQINVNDTGENDSQSVLVAAGSDYYHLGITAAAAVGAVSVTPAVDVTVLSEDTMAYIDDGARVEAEQDIWVVAHNTEEIMVVAAGAALSGVVSVGGAVGVAVIDTNAYAYIGDNDGTDGTGATALAGGNILISASDDTETFMVAGSLGVGLAAAGIGASVEVTVIDKDTQAYIGNNSVIDADGNSQGLTGIYDGDISGSDFGMESEFKGVAVQADSSEDVFTVTATAAASVEYIDSDTTAYIGAGSVITSGESVNVSAVNKTTVFVFSGGIAGGIAGIGGGVDVGSVRNDTMAYIGSGTQVYALHDVDVNALSIKDVESYAVSGWHRRSCRLGFRVVHRLGHRFHILL